MYWVERLEAILHATNDLICKQITDNQLCVVGTWGLVTVRKVDQSLFWLYTGTLLLVTYTRTWSHRSAVRTQEHTMSRIYQLGEHCSQMCSSRHILTDTQTHQQTALRSVKYTLHWGYSSLSPTAKLYARLQKILFNYLETRLSYAILFATTRQILTFHCLLLNKCIQKMPFPN